MVEGDSQPPHKDILGTLQTFFTERLAAAVETAVVRAEAKIGRIRLLKSCSIGATPGIDAATGDMPPRQLTQLAGRANDTRQDGISQDAFGPMYLAGVNVRLARVAGRVDQEISPGLADQCDQLVAIGVVDLLSRDPAVGFSS